MPKRRLSLGELELEVLKVIWERQPCSVQQVAQIVCERGPPPRPGTVPALPIDEDAWATARPPHADRVRSASPRAV